VSVENVLKSAVENNDVPFVVAMAGNAAGITYSGAAGDAGQDRAAAEDTVFRIFSMTKAIGSTAAMILIDQGKVSMDTPVAEILPQWNELQVLDGWNGDEPILLAPKTTATLRHLSTHTSGLNYEFWSADIGKYLETTGNPSILSGLKAGLHSYPLLNDPGTKWGYGTGIDWLGQVVEAVDGRRIDAFCQEEIFTPLGMTDTVFEPDRLSERLADVKIRGEDGSFAPFELAPPPQPEFYGMGHALYSTAPDYMRFLRMVLNAGELEGHRIISEAGIAAMTADQMQGKRFETMISIAPPLTADVVLPEDTTHSFAFVRTNSDQDGKRHAGTQSWAGVCNTHFWIDPKADLAAVIMTQSLPFVEPPLLKTYDAYERALYASL